MKSQKDIVTNNSKILTESLFDSTLFMDLRSNKEVISNNNSGSDNRCQDSDENKTKKLFDFDNNLIYEGEVSNKKKHGFGLEYLPNGDKFIGKFLNDKADGKGKIEFKNGESFEGNWSNGQIEGKAIHYFAGNDLLKRIKQEGFYKNNKRDGTFT